MAIFASIANFGMVRLRFRRIIRQSACGPVSAILFCSPCVTRGFLFDSATPL
jgi:hypothetical protein